MTLIVLQSLYFILPAYVANMAPLVFKFIHSGAIPMDFGISWKGERLLGSHKTWRGLFVGTLCGIAIVYAQTKLSPYAGEIELLSYDSFNFVAIFAFGVLLGGGALLGDAVKSFFKRRLGIAPGRPFVPFDQLDLIIGALLAVSILYVPPIEHIIALFILTPLLHFGVNVAAYFLTLKKVWW